MTDRNLPSIGQRITNLKAGDFFAAAGQLAAREGLANNYGQHFGMRSTRDAAAAEFHKGYNDEVARIQADEQRIRDEAALKRDYPEMKLSFGYIGNIERGRDDRSFLVFTNLKAANGNHTFSAHVFDVPVGTKLFTGHIKWDTAKVRAQLDNFRIWRDEGKLVERY